MAHPSSIGLRSGLNIAPCKGEPFDATPSIPAAIDKDRQVDNAVPALRACLEAED